MADLAGQLRPLLPGEQLSRLAAVGLMVAECTAVVLMVAAATIGYPLAAATMAVLLAGVWVVVGRGLQIPCLCFGHGKGTVLNRGHIVRNALLMILTVVGWSSHLLATPPGPPAGVALTAAVGGGILGLFLTRWDDLASLLSRPTPRSALRSFERR